jgi:hypothetical protein
MGLLLAGIAPCITGCGATRSAGTRYASLSAAGATAKSPLTGVWDLVQRSRDAEGDERIERHEFHAAPGPQGGVYGVWNSSLTWVSADGRPFLCNNESSYRLQQRTLLRSSGENGGFFETLAHTDEPGPCGVHPKATEACAARVQGSHLVLSCADRRLILSRRLDEPLPLAVALGDSKRVTGVWTWHHRSRDPDGDAKIENETWQLVQQGTRVRGYYLREVVVQSGDGRRFRCNGGHEYRNLAQFWVEGEVRGTELHLKETNYATLPGACETGQRTLDKYRGIVERGRSTIRLQFGRGSQFLYRRP